MASITFLGTAAAIPHHDRGLSCVAIKRDSDLLIFDVGEGAQAAFAKSGLGWNSKTNIFITHLHPDHCLGLPGLIHAFSMKGRNIPLYIYGPSGTAQFVRSSLSMLHFSAPFEIIVRDIAEGVVTAGDGYAVMSCENDHAIPGVSFLFQEENKPGKFYPDKAVELCVPKGPLWKKLQAGEDVTVDNGIVHSRDVVGEARRGRTVGYSGDTRPTKRLERFFVNVDHLIFDSTFEKVHSDRAKSTGHSTSTEAAVFAKNANVAHLILTHFSARYDNTDTALAEARLVHGLVTAAEDQMSINV